MQHGFIKVAAVTPKIRVADPVYNAEAIRVKMQEAAANGAQIIVFPELCLTGYTCGDLFSQELLLKETRKQLLALAKDTGDLDALVFVGTPVEHENKLYNAAAAMQGGKILAFIPKACIPGYAEFYEGRHFVQGNKEAVLCKFEGEKIPLGTNILLDTEDMDGLVVGCEICEDLWTPNPPSTSHALAGAVVIVNLSASNETIGKDAYREMLVKATSARLLSAYIYASAGEGESTQDMVFGGHNIIAENGTVLAQVKKFTCETIYGDVDIHRIIGERRRMTTFAPEINQKYVVGHFSLKKKETKLSRTFGRMPFVPEQQSEKQSRCEEILSIQSYSLKKRYEHTGCKTAVIGVSGGLDSTLALLVTVRTFDLLKLDRKGIIAVTMPCFGTTDRTYENACTLAGKLGVTLRRVDIKEAVTRHFEDIGQDMSVHDVTYENTQARERTQVLMDIANQAGGLVIGTGDMSELALGWATYNGDHMSMYGVNAGVPKTLVKHLVKHYADCCDQKELQEVLEDVLDTPVSPELLPPSQGRIAQKTEDIVGPYELHDFFLFYCLRFGFEPEKIFRLSKQAFQGIYEEEIIIKWIKVFYQRFFSQQFKRSCLPDGPKVGSVAVSPRGDLRMPSDASVLIWLTQAEGLGIKGKSKGNRQSLHLWQPPEQEV